MPHHTVRRLPLFAALFCLLPFLPALAQPNAGSKTEQLPLIDYATTRNYEIGGITINGTQYADHTVLLSLAGLSVGQHISIPGDEIPRAIRNLWKQGLFSDVKITAPKIINDIVFLEIHLTERPRLSMYSFEGTTKAEEEDLRDKISLLRGRIVNENLVASTRTTIQNFYRNKGFWNAQIDLTERKDTTFENSVILDILVNKGRKVRIEEIKITGNDNAYARKLKKQLGDTKERMKLYPDMPKRIWQKIKKANLLEVLGNTTLAETLNFIDDNVLRFKLFTSSKFKEEDYEKDKEALLAYYNELGFRDASIVRDTFYLADENRIKIELDIDEGNKYYFRNIDWKGNAKYDDDLLGRIAGIKKGDPYSSSTIQSSFYMNPNSTDVSSLYMDDGYLFFNVQVEEIADGDSIDLIVNINEGNQATIDKIIITGNDKTSEHVVRREVRSLPGSKFSRSDIIRTQRELASLGFFDPEQIQINPVPNPEKGTVDIEYKVAERSSDQLELSAGWGGTTVVGSIGVSFNNFSLRNIAKKDAWKPLPSGDGQRLSLRFQSTGKAYQAINASFTEPWLGGRRPNSLTVSLNTSRQYYSSNGDHELYTVGTSVSLGRRLRRPDDNFVLTHSLDYRYFRLLDWGRDFIISNGKSNNLSFTTTLSRFSLDQTIFPRSGSNISLSLQITPPYSLLSGKDYSDVSDEEKYRWAEYHKWKFKAEWFTPVVGKFVLRASAKMGMMGYYNEQIGHSPFERFALGGDGIGNFNLYGKEVIALRGYQDSEVTGATSGRTGHPYFTKYTLELRYPLSLNPSSTIYAQAFVEGGNSWASFRDYNPFDIRRTAGVGLRIFLPMFGILGFDYGVGFDKAWSGVGGVGTYLKEKGRFSVVLGFEPE